MTIDVSKYHKVKHAIRFAIKNNPDKDIESLITEIAVAAETPIVAVCYHYAEIIGEMTPEVQSIINKIVKFYNYTKITGSIYAT